MSRHLPCDGSIEEVICCKLQNFWRDRNPPLASFCLDRDRPKAIFTSAAAYPRQFHHLMLHLQNSRKFPLPAYPSLPQPADVQFQASILPPCCPDKLRKGKLCSQGQQYKHNQC